MKKLILSTILLFSISVTAQEKYYGQIKQVTKTKGKSSTVISKVSITIDEEYQSVAVSFDEGPTRYKIVTQSYDETTGNTTYKLITQDLETPTEAEVIANDEKAELIKLPKREKFIFDSRTPQGISLRQ